MEELTWFVTPHITWINYTTLDEVVGLITLLQINKARDLTWKFDKENHSQDVTTLTKN